MSDRDTYQLETPVSLKQVVFFKWVTGGDKRKLSNEKDESKKQEFMVRAGIKSIDGKENPDEFMKTLDAMHGKDFDFVFMELSKILIESSMPIEKKTD
jgi:hypothetical protein